MGGPRAGAVTTGKQIKGKDPGGLRPTMLDVARAANVSLKTVSRVVNGEPAVSAATALGVQRAIELLGYRRNEHARALRQHRVPRMLGLVIKDVSNPFYSAIARGVEQEVRCRSLLVVAGSSEEDAERERELLELLCERRVGGLLVVPTGSDHGYLAGELAHGTPVVFIDRPPSNLAADAIVLDNAGGARAGARHLLAHGHKRIAFVGHMPGAFTTTERVAGFRQALAEAGATVDEALVQLGCNDSASAEAATRDLLSMRYPPTAIFAGNNRITQGVARACAGLCPPPALLGFDDFELADLLSPPVSVVSYDTVELGRQAARLICERLDGLKGPPREIVLPTEVVPRGSGEVRPAQVGRRRPGQGPTRPAGSVPAPRGG